MIKKRNKMKTNELKKQAQKVKELIVAHDLANNFDYVPNFDEEKEDEFFKEFISKYGKKTVEGACESEGLRPDEVSNMIESSGLELVELIEKL
jgi:hypothetical protein